MNFRERVEKAILAGGEAILAHPPISGIQTKAPGDYITEADLVAESVILDILTCGWEISTLAEESGFEETPSFYCWVVDPLDGTTNFIHGDPHFAVSVALLFQGWPIVAGVYAPALDLRFMAEQGKGAWLNGERIQVSEVGYLSEAQVGMGYLADRRLQEKNRQILSRIGHHSGSIRVCGSAVLASCYVASGWWDAYWHVGLKPWDGAAASLIVREAGGRVTGENCEDWDIRMAPFLATNGKLHSQIWVRAKKWLDGSEAGIGHQYIRKALI